MQRPLLVPWMAVFATVAVTMFSPSAWAQPLHGALVARQLYGPGAREAAHVGETVRSLVEVVNMDDFGDSITVTSIVCVVHRATGDVFTPNLLPVPVVLPSRGDFVQVSSSYPVLPGDGDVLSDHAEVGAVDNFESGLGLWLPLGFFSSFGGQIRVVRPCLQISATCSNGVAAATIANCGNGPLANVVVSNLVNGVMSRVFGPATLSTGQVAVIAVTNVCGSGCPSATASLFASGRDELGLTVSQSAGVTCSNPAANAISIPLTAKMEGRKFHVSFESQRGKSYTLQSINSLTAPVTSWQTVSNFNGTGSILSWQSDAVHALRFYRVLMNDDAPVTKSLRSKPVRKPLRRRLLAG